MHIEVDRLTKRYGRLTALSECTLGVPRGEVFGLLGPNGSGKSTLLRSLMGMVRPSSGAARIEGFDCWRESVEVRRRTSYLPGEARLFRHLRGRDVLRLLALARPQARADAAERLAERLQLDLSRRVFFMSTGMRQKLALAAVLAAPTPLVILDEPTANLDPSVRGEVLRLVLEARDEGRTVLFSSHVLAEVEEICSRVVLLRKGLVVAVQELADLKRSHRIRAVWTGDEAPEVPPELAAGLRLRRAGHELSCDWEGDLQPLLRWLATVPLRDVRVEPLGLRSVYDRHFGAVAGEPSSAGEVGDEVADEVAR